MMRHAIAAVAIALVACAQSPHVYRPELLDTWDGVPKSLARGQNTAIVPLSGMFLCPKNVDTARDKLNELRRFTTERFIELRQPGNYEVELRDKCVFYTRNTTHGSSLSRGSTELACMYDKYSIWHLWPNARNEYDARNNDENRRRTNLYGIFLESSPLHYISKIDDIAAGNMKPAHIWYFENMSRAMGRMCSGQIYLVTDMRENLDLTQFKQGQRYWPNIWASTEWPELGNGITAHRVKDEFLIVVDFARIPYPRPVAWKVHWRRLTKTGDMGTMWTRSNGTHGEYRVPDHWEPYDLAGELSGGHESRMQRRASCLEDTGIDSEPNGMYFFG